MYTSKLSLISMNEAFLGNKSENKTRRCVPAGGTEEGLQHFVPPSLRRQTLARHLLFQFSSLFLLSHYFNPLLLFVHLYFLPATYSSSFTYSQFRNEIHDSINSLNLRIRFPLSLLGSLACMHIFLFLHTHP